MSARGEYRAVFSVLVDTPDFQALHKDARLLWYTIKMSLAAIGIGVLYDDQLVERSGLTRKELSCARGALVKGTWLAVQGRVHWLRNGLRFEPHMSLANGNHRSFVASEILGLPKLDIVNQFARYYSLSEPFPGAPTDGLRMASAYHRDTIPDHTITISPPLPLPEESAAIASVDNSGQGQDRPAEPSAPSPTAEPDPADTKKRAARPTRLPDSWQPNPAHAELAQELGVGLPLETAKFRDWAAANGRTQADWDATFRNWLRNAIQYAGGRVRAGPDFGNETKRDTTRRREAEARQHRTEAERREQAGREHAARERELNGWLEARTELEQRAIRQDAKARVNGSLFKGGKMREAAEVAALMGAIEEARARATSAEVVGA